MHCAAARERAPQLQAELAAAEGKLSQLDVIEAKRSLSQTRSAVIDARRDFHLACNRLVH